MVTKKRGTKSGKKVRVNVGKLKLNKETVKNLSAKEKRRIQGGAKGAPIASRAYTCQPGC